jgi:hypothetical protein
MILGNSSKRYIIEIPSILSSIISHVIETFIQHMRRFRY